MLKAPAKRSQHANATYPNIVGRSMLHAFGHRVAICCDMLDVVGSSLKMVKFERTTPNTGLLLSYQLSITFLKNCSLFS